MSLLAPYWLLMLVPGGLLWWWLRPAAAWNRWLRSLLLVLVVMAMCEPMWFAHRRAGTVVVVADLSASMPLDAEAAQLEAIGLLHDALDPNRHQLAVVAFGQEAAVELPPGVDPLPQFVTAVGGGASDLASALRRAQALIAPDAPGRVLLISDGRYTGGDPWADAASIAGRGVAIDTRTLSRPAAGDVAVLDVQAPDSVGPGEAFMVTAWVVTPIAQPLAYELRRGETRVASGRREFTAGTHRLRFRDRVRTPGSSGYRLELSPIADASIDDPAPENNVARFVVGVEGLRPILHITRTPGARLSSLLADAGLTVTTAAPDELDGTIDQLANHEAVVFENVAAADLPVGTLGELAGLVEETGTGLFMTGGQRSFGPGGYFNSPIDPLLPVSMELRQEHRKLSMAIVVALDRSGSMAMTVPGGQMKMDLANLGAAQVLDLMSPMDEFGVIAVDSAPHIIAPLSPVTDKDDLRKDVLSIDSMGGGIFVFEALEASARMLSNAKAGTRHIILFADAQDSENPADYKRLLEQCRKANITVSVIGLGSDRDVDAGLLRDIAARGGGRVFFTNDARKLPALFAQDTFAVARSAFVDELTQLKPTAGLNGLMNNAGATNNSNPPTAGGYNLTYLRPEALPAMVTEDEYNAPFVATWSAGLGRTAALTGEADGRFTAPLDQWSGFGELIASLTRYVARRGNETMDGGGDLPDTMLARRRVDDGRLVVELLLDPDRPTLALPAEPTARVLIVEPGVPPRRVALPLRYESADVMSTALPLRSTQTAVAALDLGNLGHVALPPARLLYDPEYRPIGQQDAQRGENTLQRLASMTGGVARLDLPGIWQDLPESRRAISVAWVFWLLAALTLLLDVFERRTGWVSGGARAVLGERANFDLDAEDAQASPGITGWFKPKPRKPKPIMTGTARPLASGNKAEAPLKASSSKPKTPQSPRPKLDDAFEVASQRSRRRTGEDK
ncbi:MAG: VWA domain-containing protein [Planctomycetota bacterium]